MTEITAEEALQAGLQTGLGYIAGGPQFALLAGGASIANALFSNPKPQTAPLRRAPLQQEAATSPIPIHGWSVVGRARKGGLIAYAADFKQGDNLVLNMAMVVSRGSLASFGAAADVFLDGQRVRYVRQTPAPGEMNPDGGTAAWYEPASQGYGHNIFNGSFQAANGLVNQDPVEGDLLFRNEGAGSFVVQQLRGGNPTTIYTLPADLNRPGEVYVISQPFGINIGDWVIRRDGQVYRWTDSTTLTGTRGEDLTFLFSLASILESDGRTWEGILNNSISWAGRSRFYENFAADGSEGVELRNTSRKGRSYERQLRGGFTEIANPEWTEAHKLQGYSWIHFLVGRDRSNKLNGARFDIPSNRVHRAPRLTRAPGIVFDLPGRKDASEHPVGVAEWLLKRRGLSSDYLSPKFAQPLSDIEGTAQDGSKVAKYRYHGIISDDQSTFEIMRILEFCAAGNLIIDDTGLAWMQQLETAPDYGEISEDDLLEGVESYDPQGRGLTANTARMSLREVAALHPQVEDWPLPDAANSILLALDRATEREDLGTAEGITDYSQGQWRLALYAQELGLRGRATFRVEATPARSRWLATGRLSVRTGQWGTLRGYIESTNKLLDGSMQVVMMVGDPLNFSTLPASSYRPLTGDIPLLLGTDSIPPVLPEPFTVEAIAGGIVVDFFVPPDADYSHVLIRTVNLLDQTERIERAVDSPHNVLNLRGSYEVSLASVDREENQSVWTAPVRVNVRPVAEETVQHAFIRTATPIAPVIPPPSAGVDPSAADYVPTGFVRDELQPQLPAGRYVWRITRHPTLPGLWGAWGSIEPWASIPVQRAFELTELGEGTFRLADGVWLDTGIADNADYDYYEIEVDDQTASGVEAQLIRNERVVEQQSLFLFTPENELQSALWLANATTGALTQLGVVPNQAEAMTYHGNRMLAAMVGPGPVKTASLWHINLTDPAQSTKLFDLPAEMGTPKAMSSFSNAVYIASASGLWLADLARLRATKVGNLHADLEDPVAMAPFGGVLLAIDGSDRTLWGIRVADPANSSRIPGALPAALNPSAMVAHGGALLVGDFDNRALWEADVANPAMSTKRADLPALGEAEAQGGLGSAPYTTDPAGFPVFDLRFGVKVKAAGNTIAIKGKAGSYDVKVSGATPVASSTYPQECFVAHAADAGSIGDLNAALEAENAEQRKRATYLPARDGFMFTRTVPEPTAETPLVWRLTRLFSTDEEQITDWEYSGVFRRREAGVQTYPQECFVAHASDAGTIAELDAALAAEDKEARKGVGYLPVRAGFVFSFDVLDPTKDAPNIWRLTRTFSTEESQITDWEYAGILRVRETDTQTFIQECFVLHDQAAITNQIPNVPLTDQQILDTWLQSENAERRKMATYLPSRSVVAPGGSSAFTRSIPDPTEALPMVWRLTRTFSTDDTKITDWEYTGRLRTLERDTQTFIQECFVAHAANAGSVADLDNALEAEDAERRKMETYLPARRGFAYTRTIPDPTKDAPNVWKLTRTFSTDSSKITDWQYAGTIRVRETDTQTYIQECFVAHASDAGSVGDLNDALEAENADRRKMATYLPARQGFAYTRNAPNPSEATPDVWRLTRLFSTDDTKITDWAYADIYRSLATTSDTETFLQECFVAHAADAGSASELDAALAAEDADARKAEGYLPVRRGFVFSFDVVNPTKDAPNVWRLTRKFSSDDTKITDWRYAGTVRVREVDTQTYPQECFVAHASNAGSVGDLNSELEAENAERRKMATYLPARRGFVFSRSVPDPSKATPNVWRLTRTFSTDDTKITDWEYAGIVRTLEKDTETYPQECFVAYAANAGSATDLDNALEAENAERRKMATYLPARRGFVFSRSIPDPTKDTPNVWRLTRTFSTDDTKITDWSHAGTIRVREVDTQTFVQECFVAHAANAGSVADLDNALEAENAERRKMETYLPARRGFVFSRSIPDPTAGAPNVWRLTRRFSTDDSRITDWQYAGTIRVREVDTQTYPQECFVAHAANAGSVGDLNDDLEAEDAEQRKRATYLPGRQGFVFSRSIPAPSKATPNVWKLTRRFSTNSDLITDWAYAGIVREAMPVAPVLPVFAVPAASADVDVKGNLNFDLPQATISSGEALEYVFSGELINALTYAIRNGKPNVSGQPNFVRTTTHTLTARVAADHTRFAVALVVINIFVPPELDNRNLPTL